MAAAESRISSRYARCLFRIDIHGALENGLSANRVVALFDGSPGQQIDVDPEPLLKFVLHGKEIEARVTAGAKGDQQIDVAARTRFPPGDGAEYFKTSYSVPAASLP